MTDFDAVSPLRDRLRPVETVVVQRPGVVPAEVFQSNAPIVIKGLANEWPVLNAVSNKHLTLPTILLV